MGNTGSAASRWHAALGLIVAVALVATGCSTSASPAHALQRTRFRVSAAAGGRIVLDGAVLTIPRGGLNRDATVRATKGGTTTGALPSEVVSVGTPVRFDLGGAALTKPARLELPVDPSRVSKNATVVGGYLDETVHRWVRVGGTLNPQHTRLSLKVEHLSLWQPWTWDFGPLSLKLTKVLTPVATFRAPLAHCGAADQGVSLSVSGGPPGDPPLDGCVEAANGRTRVRLWNNRAYGAIVHAPAGAVLEHTDLNQLADALYAHSSTGMGGDYVPAVGEIDYLADTHGPALQFTSDWSWKAYTLDTSVALLFVLAKGPVADLASVAKCLGDEWVAPPATEIRTAAGGVQRAIGCLGVLDRKKVFLAPLAAFQSLLVADAGAFDAGQDNAHRATGAVTVTRLAPISTAPACTAAALLAVPGAPQLDPGGHVVGPECHHGFAIMGIAAPPELQLDGGTSIYRQDGDHWTYLTNGTSVPCGLAPISMPSQTVNEFGGRSPCGGASGSGSTPPDCTLAALNVPLTGSASGVVERTITSFSCNGATATASGTNRYGEPTSWTFNWDGTSWNVQETRQP